MFSEVICNRFTEVAYLVHVMCTVLWLRSLISKASSRSVLISMKSKRHCTSVVRAMPLLINVEKKTRLIGRFLDRGDRQPPGLLSLIMLHPLKASGPTHL